MSVGLGHLDQLGAPPEGGFGDLPLPLSPKNSSIC